VKKALEVTKESAARITFSGAVGGYETLLNTNSSASRTTSPRSCTCGRARAVDRLYRQFLIEPKPKEPTTPVRFRRGQRHPFLRTYGLERHFKFNIETTTPRSRHTFNHEIESLRRGHARLHRRERGRHAARLGHRQFNTDVKELTLP